MMEGWRCPICLCVYSPTTWKCTNCGKIENIIINDVKDFTPIEAHWKTNTPHFSCSCVLCCPEKYGVPVKTEEEKK